MADVLSVVTGAISLVGTVLISIETITRLGIPYKNAHHTIDNIKLQCAFIKTALLLIESVMLDNADHLQLLCTDADMAQTLDAVFSTFQVEFVVLNERLGKLVLEGKDEEGGMSRMARIKHMWNEQRMQNLLQNIQTLANGLNLVFSALQLKSSAEMHARLRSDEARNTIQMLENDAKCLQEKEANHNQIPSSSSGYPAVLDCAQNPALCSEAMVSLESSCENDNEPPSYHEEYTFSREQYGAVTRREPLFNISTEKPTGIFCEQQHRTETLPSDRSGVSPAAKRLKMTEVPIEIHSSGNKGKTMCKTRVQPGLRRGCGSSICCESGNARQRRKPAIFTIIEENTARGSGGARNLSTMTEHKNSMQWMPHYSLERHDVSSLTGPILKPMCIFESGKDSLQTQLGNLSALSSFSFAPMADHQDEPFTVDRWPLQSTQPKIRPANDSPRPKPMGFENTEPSGHFGFEAENPKTRKRGWDVYHEERDGQDSIFGKFKALRLSNPTSRPGSRSAGNA